MVLLVTRVTKALIESRELFQPVHTECSGGVLYCAAVRGAGVLRNYYPRQLAGGNASLHGPPHYTLEINFTYILYNNGSQTKTLHLPNSASPPVAVTNGSSRLFLKALRHLKTRRPLSPASHLSSGNTPFSSEALV